MGLGTWLADRRALAELRALRRAAERIADALELQVQQAPRPGQTFRGFSRALAGGPDLSSVSYADPGEQAAIDQAASELRAFLGRDPTEEELLRAVEGRVE